MKELQGTMRKSNRELDLVLEVREMLDELTLELRSEEMVAFNYMKEH